VAFAEALNEPARYFEVLEHLEPGSRCRTCSHSCPLSTATMRLENDVRIGTDDQGCDVSVLAPLASSFSERAVVHHPRLVPRESSTRCHPHGGRDVLQTRGDSAGVHEPSSTTRSAGFRCPKDLPPRAVGVFHHQSCGDKMTCPQIVANLLKACDRIDRDVIDIPWDISWSRNGGDDGPDDRKDPHDGS
jgi:hypothetical protein